MGAMSKIPLALKITSNIILHKSKGAGSSSWEASKVKIAVIKAREITKPWITVSKLAPKK